MKLDLLLKKDFIVKEELQRSVVVYFISFLFIAVPSYGVYIPGDALGTFTLAFILTAAHFMFMVWYRKKEPLVDPSIYSIIDHEVGTKSSYRKNSIYPESGLNLRLILMILGLAYLIYFYGF